MPLYEYLCLSCRNRFTLLRSVSERNNSTSCANCSEKKVNRLVSSFRTIRTEEQIVESLADASKMPDFDENNPGQVTQWAKKVAREMGENMDEEIDSMAEEELTQSDQNSDGISDHE